MFFGRAELELALRRERLLMRSAELRGELALDSVMLLPPLQWADGAIDAWRWLKSHADLALAGVAVVVVLRPRRAWRLARLGWRGWRTWRLVRVMASKALAGFERGGGFRS